MTHPTNAPPTPEPTPQPSTGGFWISRYGYWFLAVLLLLLLAFNVVAQLFLDTDEADARYIHVAISAERFAGPVPGAVYVYDHAARNFTAKSPQCFLQYFDDYAEEERTISASNVLGLSVNQTMQQFERIAGEWLEGFANVERATNAWTFVKQHRPMARAPMDPSCLDVVMRYVANPNTTPFIVDMIYIDSSQNGAVRWVSLAPPVIFDPATCTEGTCPEPKTPHDVVHDLTNPFTKIKAGWNILTFEGPMYDTKKAGDLTY